MAKSSFEALKNYESSLNALEELRASRRGQASNQTLRYKILSVLHARDQLEQIVHDRCQTPYPLPSSMLEQIDQLDKLDKRLKKQSGAIAKYLDLEKWRKLYKVTDAERWWWYSVHPCDRLDWLWKFLTAVCVVVLLSILLDFIPRFWAGGSSVWGAIAVIGPALLTWFLGKDLSEGVSWIRQNIDAALDAVLKVIRLPISKPWRREVALLLALILAGLAWWNSQNFKNWIANLYYNSAAQHLKLQENSVSGSQQISDSKLSADAEANLKRAIAFDPDHEDAHFQLGYLYELRQDVEIARSEYKLAMQGGSLNAIYRLAWFYLKDDKKDTEKQSAEVANGILMQGGSSVEALRKKGTNETLKDKQARLSWFLMLAWTYLKQDLDSEAENQIDEAKEVYEQIKPKKSSSVSTVFDCIQAELFQKQKKFEKEIDKSWEDCKSNTATNEPLENFWNTRAMKHLKSKD